MLSAVQLHVYIFNESKVHAKYNSRLNLNVKLEKKIVVQFSFIHMWQRWSSRERLQNKEHEVSITKVQ